MDTKKFGGLLGFIMGLCLYFSLKPSKQSIRGKKVEKKEEFPLDIKMWNRQEPIKPATKDKDCKWATFRSINGNEAPMCVHSHGDVFISHAISREGRFRGTEAIIDMYEKNKVGDNDIYVDIGANIGAFLMEILLDTNAEIVAFEPNPDNLFCLTSTLVHLGPEFAKRVTLYPIGLGALKTQTTINAPQQNMGNGVVGRVVRDQPGQKFNAPIPIWVESFDKVWSTTKRIAMIKMDVQGFECEVLRGGFENFKRAQGVLSEMDSHYLLETTDDCSKKQVIAYLDDCGFTYKGGERFTKK